MFDGCRYRRWSLSTDGSSASRKSAERRGIGSWYVASPSDCDAMADMGSVPTKTVLSGNTKTLRSLIEMAGSFMNPTREGGDERDAWAGFGVWVWRVIEELAEHSQSS